MLYRPRDEFRGVEHQEDGAAFGAASGSGAYENHYESVDEQGASMVLRCLEHGVFGSDALPIS